MTKKKTSKKTPDQKLSVEYVSIASLHPDPDNPRWISPDEFESLKKSISTFGFVDPIITRADGLVIGGHQRLEVAKALGLEEVPVIRLTLTGAATKALNIALNRISGEFDPDKLTAMLKTIEDEDQVLLNAVGMAERELNDILRVDDWIKEKAPAALPIEQELKIDLDTPFRSDEIYDIPPLMPEKMGVLPNSLETWAPNAKLTTEGALYVWPHVPKEPLALAGVMCFYTDDQDFLPLWDDPERGTKIFEKYQIRTFVSPDFSLYQKSPQALRIYNAYRARWLSRYWQERGFNCIPSITAGNDKDLHFLTAGWPKRCPALAISGQSIDDSVYTKASRQRMIAEAKKKIDFDTLFVYGVREADLKWWEEVSRAAGKALVTVTSFMYQRLAAQANPNPNQDGSEKVVRDGN